MTAFYAAYLFLALAVILLVVGLFFKKTWILIVSGLGWLCVGIYAVSVANQDMFIDILGIFCILVGIGVMATGNRINRKPPVVIVKKSRIEEMSDRYEQVKKARSNTVDRGF